MNVAKALELTVRLTVPIGAYLLGPRPFAPLPSLSLRIPIQPPFYRVSALPTTSLPGARHHYSTAAPNAPQISYHIASSYSAKGHRLDPERNLYNYDSFVKLKKTASELDSGKKDKKNRPKSGQDSFFISQVGDTSSVAFGVADGVGGWADSGVDAADFAHALCDYMASAASAYPNGFPQGALHPKELLQSGYDRVIKDKSVDAGGSTASLAIAETDGQMQVANLGDSGFLHIGVNAVRHVSPAQTHAFNTPYQLSKIPKQMQAQMALFSGSQQLSDLPKDAAISNHQLRHGDIAIFATDGVFDNLSPEDMLKIVSRYMVDLGAWDDTESGIEISGKLRSLTQRGASSQSGDNSLQAVLAIAVTNEAKKASLNARRDGPFAKEVQKHYPGENWHGGKPDDICVVVAVAVGSK